MLTFFIRIFVPESEKWEKEKAAGSTSHWATQDLLGVLIGVCGAGADRLCVGVSPDISTVAACGLSRRSLGLVIAIVRLYLSGDPLFSAAAAGHRRRELAADAAADAAGGVPVGRGAAGHVGLDAVGAVVGRQADGGESQGGATEADRRRAKRTAAQKLVRPRGKEYAQIWLAVGAIVGTILAAMMGDWMGRRPAYCLLVRVVAGVGLCAVLWAIANYGPAMLFWTFVAGTMTASFYGWLPLYLPELFRTNVRATGQGFGFNFGRILAAIGVLQTGNLMGLFKEDAVIAGITIPAGYPLACSTMSLIYLVGIVHYLAGAGNARQAAAGMSRLAARFASWRKLWL